MLKYWIESLEKSGKVVSIFKGNLKTISLCVGVYLFNYVFTILFYIYFSLSYMQVEDFRISQVSRRKTSQGGFLCQSRNWSFCRQESKHLNEYKSEGAMSDGTAHSNQALTIFVR